MITFEKQSGRAAVLALEGDLTVSRADELRNALLTTMSSADHIVLDVQQVTGIDLACLQLLCSAHRTSVTLNKQVTLANNRPEVFARIVGDSGFARHAACVEGATCLWMQE